ncbi:MAG TPA: hypothetical protein DCF91_11785 [Porphyromonadaceae bacterium]|nr:hypothetical protein [Porphyromonadaceae bacterium]
MDELKESLDSNIYLYSHPIDESLLDNIVSDLQKNPPLKPDYKRLVNVYTNKLQYVKLKINGLNVDDSKVKLPKDTLPIRNKELIKKIESKLSLFTEKDKDEYFQELKKYKDEISEIRKKHLTPLKTRDESILHLDKKLLFNDEINNVVDKYKKHVKDSVHLLQNKITNTKTNLLSVLTEFFMLNKEELIDKDSLFKNNIEYLDYLAKTKAEDIVHKIKWPNAHELIKKLEVNIMYSDITFEDLKNKNLLNELVEKEIIDKSDFNELAEFSQAIVLENND